MLNLRACTTKASNCLTACPSRDTSSDLPVSELCDLNLSPISSCRKSGKYVTFSDDVKIIEEPEDLANDLQNARISDFPKRQADRERMERLLAPILTVGHRGEIYQKIYGEY